MGNIIGNLDDPRLPYDYQQREFGTVKPDDKRERFQWVSEVAYKNVHRIVARGYDTTELVEAGYGITDVIFVDFQSRIPTIEENQMLNYVMIMSLEDGLSGPAAMARIAASGKTLLTQAAGASILAFGHAFGAFAAIGKMLDEYLARAEQEGVPTAEMAKDLVREHLNDPALGVSNLMLRDPAAKRMQARARKLGVAGKYTAFMQEVVAAAQAQSGHPVDLDMLGAAAAAMFDLGFSPDAAWAILAVTRAFAAGAHYCEEVERGQPYRLGQCLAPKDLYDGPDDRPVPSLDDRTRHARSGVTQTPEEWKQAFDAKQKMVGTGWPIIEPIEDPRRKI